jgi:hypothetical protein
MKRKIILCIALGLFIPFSDTFASEPLTNSQPHKLVHNWEYITFPEVLIDGKNSPTFSVGYGEKSQGFRLDIMDIMPGFFKTNVITARLYRANGEIVTPTAEGKQLLNKPISITTASPIPGVIIPAQVMTFFPWGTNTIEESWIEVFMGTERYWLEIPYGFDRNPNEPLPPSIPGGRPKFVTAMKSLTDHDHVLRWQNVQYDLGKIQNGWQLSLIQSNPFDAESEAVLYRDDSVVGKSMYLWDLHTPRTSLRVLDADGSVINGFCVSLRLHDDGMRRSDTFDIGRNGFDDQRSWGQIEITVDGKSYRVVVPSSLFKYTHGHASANLQNSLPKL